MAVVDLGSERPRPELNSGITKENAEAVRDLGDTPVRRAIASGAVTVDGEPWPLKGGIYMQPGDPRRHVKTSVVGTCGNVSEIALDVAADGGLDIRRHDDYAPDGSIIRGPFPPDAADDINTPGTFEEAFRPDPVRDAREAIIAAIDHMLLDEEAAHNAATARWDARQEMAREIIAAIRAGKPVPRG